MAVVAGNEIDQGAAARESDNAWAQAKQVDPELLMAAHCGNSKRLKELLRVNDEDQYAHDMVEAAEASEAVIVDVVPRRPPAPAAAPDEG